MSAIVDRSFIKKARQQIDSQFSNTKIGEVFERCMNNTLDTTIKIKGQETFIVTGDIPAMWLRDSVCQVRPFLRFAEKDSELEGMLIGLINQQMRLIKEDPYANAFNESSNGAGHQEDLTDMQDGIWERKYEIDSLCYPIQLSYLLWKKTGTTAQFNTAYLDSIDLIIELWEQEQHHEESSPYRFQRQTEIKTDTLERGGRGTETSYTGMTWSGFRPSDDACTYGYLVPANQFAVVVLGYLAEILDQQYKADSLRQRVTKLKSAIKKGIEKYAVVQHATYGEIYAYEVDGQGNQLLMDDANVPSLLSLPFLGYCAKDDPRYLNTRQFILSKANPYFYTGKVSTGIGSPHTPKRYIWPISLAVQGLTSQYESELRLLVNELIRTDADCGMMHESFDADDAKNYTREWFSWANMMFCELVLDIVQTDN
ncbi:glycoside hydrolase family 125 protein [Vagococcus sp. BWB3-3]|uniref:Glycoside hydrolase family 125 protein n=1 Tax=Vagococcus allomyrinae TaxID=2794353 RepID=A0A940PA94_9ENTE|nr:glycoside hydrolase family 125 protein [Vagococcus allomyrinae]